MNLRELDHQLKGRRIVMLGEDIDERVAYFIKRRLTELAVASPDEVTLIIDCHGGDIRSAFEIYDFISVFGLPVTGLVAGKCESAALTVLLGCQHRHAVPHSTFFFHHGHSHPCIKAGKTEKEYVKQIRAMMRMNARYDGWEMAVLRKRTRLTRRQIEGLKHAGEEHGESVSAQEALAWGVIDKIVEKFQLFDQTHWLEELAEMERQQNGVG